MKPCWRYAKRELRFLAETCCRGVDFGDVDEDSWSDTVFSVGCRVLVDRDLVRRPGIIEVFEVISEEASY